MRRGRVGGRIGDGRRHASSSLSARTEADLAEFIEPSAPGPGAGDGRVTAWTWKSVPEPALASLPPRGQAWEITRYRAYQAQLAGHTIAEIFGRATEFLKLAAANAPSITDVSAHAAL